VKKDSNTLYIKEISRFWGTFWYASWLMEMLFLCLKISLELCY